MAERFVDTADPKWESLINAIKEGKELAINVVETAQILNLAVTEAKIASEAVTEAKVKRTPLPATPAGEGEVETGAAGVPRTSISMLSGKNAQTKFKIKHGLATSRLARVQALKVTAKVPGSPYLEAAGAGNYTWTSISATEIEVTFGTELKATEEAAVIVTAA